jgi:transcription elongation factor Elf1
MPGIVCERCQNESLEVLHTISKKGKLYRERRCKQCGLIIETEEKAINVEIYDNHTMGKRKIDINKYREDNKHD